VKNLLQNIERFLISEDGPTAVGFAVKLALILVGRLGAIQAIGTNANTTFTTVGNML